MSALQVSVLPTAYKKEVFEMIVERLGAEEPEVRERLLNVVQAGLLLFYLYYAHFYECHQWYCYC